jgi:hypothetical protein
MPSCEAEAHCFLLGSMGLTAVGVWMIAAGDFRGWLVAGFFAIGIASTAVMLLLPGAGDLVLDSQGSVATTLLYRSRWTDARAVLTAPTPSCARRRAMTRASDYSFRAQPI